MDKEKFDLGKKFEELKDGTIGIMPFEEMFMKFGFYSGCRDMMSLLIEETRSLTKDEAVEAIKSMQDQILVSYKELLRDFKQKIEEDGQEKV